MYLMTFDLDLDLGLSKMTDGVTEPAIISY